MADSSTGGSDAHFLIGGGEMAALMRAHDWFAMPLGAPEAWPQPLRLAIRLLLNTGHPMYVWWGPDLRCFYNDAFRQSIGPERHPNSLGQPACEPGEGTSVRLWLPVSFAPVDRPEKASTQVMTGTYRGKALLVDDEELVRMSTADMLKDLGFEVTEAGSAEEAMRLVEAGEKPDLLVTDHLMPGMNGADLARALRAKTADLPVLIVSGYADVEGIAPDLPRLSKPFRNAELAERIASLPL